MKQLLLLVAALYSFTAVAQDIITKTNGDEVQAKVLEITDTEVKYKKWSNQDGPSYTEKKANIFMIKYSNGDKDLFGNSGGNQDATQSVEAADVSLSPNELEELRKKYDVDMDFKKDAMELKSNKVGKSGFFQMAPCSDAVFADQNIEVEFQTTRSQQYDLYDQWALNWCVQINVINKTNTTIYLDLANSFFMRGTNSTPYYIPQATAQSQTAGGGVSMNAGAIANSIGIGGAVGTALNGVNVSRGSSNTRNTITYSQRVIAIPPQSSQKLDMQPVFTSETKDATDLNVANFHVSNRGIGAELVSPNMNLGTRRFWEEAESPFRLGAYISYSDNESCTKLNSVKSSFYLKKMMPVRIMQGGPFFPSANIDNIECVSGNKKYAIFFSCHFLSGKKGETMVKGER